MSEAPARWRDLSTRVISAVVMVAVTAIALTSGMTVWLCFVFAIYAAMIWELMGLCDPATDKTERLAMALLPLLYPMLILGMGVIMPGGMAFLAGGYVGVLIGLVAPLIAGLAVVKRSRLIWLAYGAMLAVAALCLIYLYEHHGLLAVVSLVALVAISDMAGYFAGRALGGPKFWPAISPKKTWSGTAAGWICCGIFGLIVLPRYGFSLPAAGIGAVALCFAAQMGDIAESALKRRAGVKDASALIPGHGGVLDRLDALVAAASLAGLYLLILGL